MSGVSLGDELGHIAEALSGVQELVEQRAEGDPELRAHAGLLALITERLRLVRRVVKGDLSAELLAAPHNRRTAVAPGEDGDVVLPLRAPRRPNASGRRRAR